MAMIGGEAEAAPNRHTATDCSETSSDPPSPREQLARDLENLAAALRKTHKGLTKPSIKGGQKDFWEQGIEAVQGHLENVVFLLEKCQGLLEGQKKDVERKAQEPSPGHVELMANTDTLSEALEGFDNAIILAFEKLSAARGSVEMPDQDFSSRSRSRDFVEAANQLKELAGFCEGTAVLVRGPAALAREAGDAEAAGSAP